MAEYVGINNIIVKLGTCECLYYVSYDKYKTAFDKGLLRWVDGNCIPATYLDRRQGFMFRFPFPDEDKLKFGEIKEPYNRTVDMLIDKKALNKMLGDDGRPEGKGKIAITYQKPVYRQSDGVFCMAIVYEDLATGRLYRIEDYNSIKMIVGQLAKHHILHELDPEKKDFYRQVACRIIKGYMIEDVGKSKELKKENEENKRKIRRGPKL